MVTVKIDEPIECYDEQSEEIFYVPPFTYKFEHSLEAISKWESKWHVCYLETDNKTYEQTYDYIRCMCLSPYEDDRIFYCFPDDAIQKIVDYISDPKTATTISKNSTGGGAESHHETLTSEVIYCYMSLLNIPFECDKWPLERLLMLIQVANIKNSPEKKMTKSETQEYYRNLNKQRRPPKNPK